MNKFTRIQSLLNRNLTENAVLATGSYHAVLKKLYKIDKSAAMAQAEIENSNGTHKGKTATYFTTKIGGRYHLTKDKPLSESTLKEKVSTFTSGHKPDPKYTYKLMIDGEVEGEYQSLSQAQAIVKNRQKIKGIPRKFNITKHPRKKLAGPKGKLPE